MSNHMGLMFLSNDGAAKFSLRSRRPVAADPMSLAAADYDNDGDVDVYICATFPAFAPPGPATFLGGDTAPAVPIPYHDANNGGRNVLFENRGDLRFVDVTSEVGLDAANRKWSFAASWEDYDNDGDMDLYVANDNGRNNLYRNDAGRFVDAAAEAGVEDIAAGMSASWGDSNSDGLMDLYVGNMFSSAGNRITWQQRFKPGLSSSVRGEFRRHARGNSLFENLGGGRMSDVSVPAAVTIGRWAWGSLFVDINNDGFEDIFVANGYVTQEDTGDL